MRKFILGILILAISLIAGYLFWRDVLLERLEFFYGPVSYITASLFGLVIAFSIPELISGKVKDRKRKIVQVNFFSFLGKSIKFVVKVLIFGAIITFVGLIIDASFGGMVVSSNYTTPVCEEVTSLDTLSSSDPIGGPLGKVWIDRESLAPSDIGLKKARSVEEIDTLICITSDVNKLEVCDYGYGSGINTRRITRYQWVWNVVVIDWNTRQIRATKSFQGNEPDLCPSSTSFSDEKYGSYPSSSSIGTWLAGIEVGKTD